MALQDSGKSTFILVLCKAFILSIRSEWKKNSIQCILKFNLQYKYRQKLVGYILHYSLYTNCIPDSKYFNTLKKIHSYDN